MNNSIFYYLPADVDKLYKHVRWRVHRRWRVQPSTTLCTLVTTDNFEYIRGCVINSTFYYFPAEVYKLYHRRMYFKWGVHKRWRVQQSTTLCTLVNNGISKVHTRLRVQQYTLYLPADVYKLYNRRIHVRWRVHRKSRVQQSTTLCTLVTTEYLKYIQDCVYNSTFYFLPADVYNLYKHVW